MLSNTYTPGSGEVKPPPDSASGTSCGPASAPPSGSENPASGVDIPSWELRVEGRLLDEVRLRSSLSLLPCSSNPTPLLSFAVGSAIRHRPQVEAKVLLLFQVARDRAG